MSTPEPSSDTQCHAPYEDDAAKLIESGKEGEEAMMQALESSGAMACNYTNSNGQMQFCAAAGLGMRLGCGQASVSVTQTQGCQSLNVLTNTLNKINKNVTCVLNNAKGELSTNVMVEQQIKLKMGNVVGSVINLKQLTGVTVNMVSVASNEAQDAITNAVKSAIDDSLNQTQSTQNEAGSNPQSQITMSKVTQNLSDYNDTSKIRNTYNKVFGSVASKQYIELDLGDVTNSTIELTQQNAVSLITKMFINSVAKDIMHSDEISTVSTDAGQTNTQENTGYKQPNFLEGTNMTTGSVIVIVVLGVLALVGAGIALKIYMNKKKGPLPM